MQLPQDALEERLHTNRHINVYSMNKMTGCTQAHFRLDRAGTSHQGPSTTNANKKVQAQPMQKKITITK
jgi:hypothetical protein